MNIIVCVDDNNGMLFHNRRLSMDRALRDRMLAVTGGAKLWMNAYSGKQFEPLPPSVIIDEDFMRKAQEGDYCFVEDPSLLQGAAADRIILYQWNRRYPADQYFPADVFKKTLAGKYEFAGNSHEKITEEIYE